MCFRATALIGLVVPLLTASPAAAQPICTITQITSSPGDSNSRKPSLDGGAIAFSSTADLTPGAPGNADGNREIFLWDGTAFHQITNATGNAESDRPSLDVGMIAFDSTGDLTPGAPGNADGSREIFLWDGAALHQITDGPQFDGSSRKPSLDGGTIAFHSIADLDPSVGNPDHSVEIFFWDGAAIHQITDSMTSSANSSLDDGSIAFDSFADLDPSVGNSDGSKEVFLYDGTFHQITDSSSTTFFSGLASLDGGSIAFRSNADLDPSVGNADGNFELFFYDGATITQVTDSAVDVSSHPASLDAGAIAFSSTGDLTGGNGDGSFEVFLWDGVAIAQISSDFGAEASLDGTDIAFLGSTSNPPTEEAYEIFLYDCEPAPGPIDEIPAVGATGLAVLALLLAAAAVIRMRRVLA